MKTTINYSEVCWSCGKAQMRPIGTYYQCTACGATWNEMPKVGPPCVTIDREADYHHGVVVSQQRYRPVKKRARKTTSPPDI